MVVVENTESNCGACQVSSYPSHFKARNKFVDQRGISFMALSKNSALVSLADQALDPLSVLERIQDGQIDVIPLDDRAL